MSSITERKKMAVDARAYYLALYEVENVRLRALNAEAELDSAQRAADLLLIRIADGQESLKVVESR